MTLTDLGWNDAFEKEFAPFRVKGWQPARLVRDNRITYGALLAGAGDLVEVEATPAGKIFHGAHSNADLPAVGDWVALELAGDGKSALIQARLARAEISADLEKTEPKTLFTLSPIDEVLDDEPEVDAVRDPDVASIKVPDLAR